MKKIGFACSLVVLLLCLPACNSKSQLSDLEPQLDRFLGEMQQRWGVPGLAVAITDKEQVLYTKAIGVRNLKTGAPLKPEHLFHMASVSKPFSATAIMQLVEQGKMELDAPVTTYVPYFRLDDERYKQITIRQMLTHTSGMPDENDYEWDNPQYDDGAAERYVRSLANETMIAAPGEKWQYSNMAFDVLGDVIAKVSGQSFEAYIKENILLPLEMTESSFLRSETKEELRTSPHVGVGYMTVSDVYPYNRRHAPSSALNASVVEMANWAIANLNRGAYKGTRILSDASYGVLWDPAVQISEGRHNGLSWFLESYREVATISHSGRDTGYMSYFTLLPEQGYGVIVVCNDYFGPIVELRNGIIDLLLGYEPEIQLPSIMEEFDRIYKTQGLEAAKAHYRRLEQSSQDEYVFGWAELRDYGRYHLYALNEGDAAIDLFKFNMELYPEEPGVYEELGDGYKKAGDSKSANKMYSKALEFDPENTGIKEKIEELKDAED